MKTPQNVVGPLIRELREKKGFTQAALATKLNLLGWDISRDTFAKIEAQTRWVKDFELVKLATALKVDAPDLLRQAVAKGGRRPKTLPKMLR
jgi:transcriptional regulator with XRE-family HTH domain